MAGHAALYGGYVHETEVDVYSKRQGDNENSNYRVIDSFENIDYIQEDGVRCASTSQAFNDVLEDFDNAVEQALVEGLAGYYFGHGESFDGLVIKPGDMGQFMKAKDWAMEYCDIHGQAAGH
ncbi:MAG: hypothetical protein LBP92_07940 [Deltaproteobacteria bacterium]|nr:hypothetical protein [Deltaproteobacteria bacterium]